MASVYSRLQKVSHTQASDAPIILMVSGGADSCALTILAAEDMLTLRPGAAPTKIARHRLHIMHFNHQLRGNDADLDAAFVQELGAHYGIPVHVFTADVARVAASKQLAGDSNVESVGRRLRYEAAYKLARELAAAEQVRTQDVLIATAHTQNDRAETFLMNLMRGAGPSGLASIPFARGKIIRPLLGYTHEDLKNICRAYGVVWREDLSNLDTNYLRAYVRHEILPKMRERSPQTLKTINQCADIMSDEDSYLEGVAARMLAQLVQYKEQGVLVLDRARLAAVDIALARRIVRLALRDFTPPTEPLTLDHTEQILVLVARGEGSHMVPKDVLVRAHKRSLSIAQLGNAHAPTEGFLPVPGTIAVGENASIRAQILTLDDSQDPEQFARAHAQEWGPKCVLVDAAALGFTPNVPFELWVDTMRPGDVMQPFGADGRYKKVSDLLADAHVAQALRARVPIVRSAPGAEIVWVAGIRLSNAYRATKNSQWLLELKFEAGAERSNRE